MQDFSNLAVRQEAGNQRMRIFCSTEYHLATPAIAALARHEHSYKEQKFSDHAPITIDYDWGH